MAILNNAYYTATFDGRGHTISNLYIDRSSPDGIGLFGFLGTGSNLRNLGIEGGSVTGGGIIGGLVGWNRGTIIACYATGDANGTSWVGVLVGNNDGIISACYATGDATGTGNYVSGLVGRNGSGATIIACYATGNAMGDEYVGGLVGWNGDGIIIACYARGDASGNFSVGGLVGLNGATIRVCYATGDASGIGPVGGLVGEDFGGTVTNSYFDYEASNRPDSDDHAKTTAELQTPTAYDDNTDARDGSSIYETWDIDVDDGQPIGVEDGTAAGDSGTDNPWDFGTNGEYPALQVDFNVDGAPSVAEFGMQPRVAPMAPAAPSALTATAANAEVTLSWIAPSENGGAEITNYMIEHDNTDMNFSSPTPVPTTNTATSYTVSGLANGTLYYFRVAAVNSVGTGAYYPGASDAAVSATPADNLIDVTTLEQLNAIRYDLNGDGVVSFTTAASLTGSPMFSDRTAVVALMGAASAYAEVFTSGDFYTAVDATTAATGAVAASTTYYYKLSSAATSPYTDYELMNNLDFEDANGDGTADDKSIWAEGASGAGVSGAVAEGWAPIGDNSTDSDATRFTATFDGRGHTISNLYINRSARYSGLFGRVSGEVRNLGLEGGAVTSTYATDYSYTGGLAGTNSGTITSCYSTGAVTGGTGGNSEAGGLVGWNDSGSTISACYSTGAVTGGTGADPSAGSLVGYNNGTISACYSTGAVAGGTGADPSAGGLAGYNDGTISACYSTGVVTGDTGANPSAGGLVGFNNGPVRNSYFDSSTSGQTEAIGMSGSMSSTTNVDGKTTMELQTPTAYGTAADIYANWNIDVDNGLDVGVEDGTEAGDSGTDNPWDFGTNSEYPALRVDFNVSGTPTAFEFGGQGRAAAAPAASSALTATAANAEVTLNWDAPSENGGVPITGYMIEHDTDMNFPLPTPVTTTDAATSYTVSGLTNGTLYYFRVAAVNSAGTAAYYPGAADAAVSATPATVPDAPSALMATAANAAVTLSWTAAASDGGAPITGYMIEHDTDMNFPSPTPVTTTDAATSYTVSGLANGTLYYFRVAAVNSMGTGAYYPGMGDAAVSAMPVVPLAISRISPTAGAVGATVMITGTGFSATATENTVTFLGRRR